MNPFSRLIHMFLRQTLVIKIFFGFYIKMLVFIPKKQIIAPVARRLSLRVENFLSDNGFYFTTSRTTVPNPAVRLLSGRWEPADGYRE